MELKICIKQDPNMNYIVFFEGLPGCLSKGKSINEAIQNAYKELTNWKKGAFLSGFDCFKACLH